MRLVVVISRIGEGGIGVEGLESYLGCSVYRF